MANKGIEITEDKIIFHNLRRAGDMVGQTRAVEAVNTASKAMNSSGLRTVESIQEAGEIARSAARNFAARFPRQNT